jgi:uncharacterized SAM-dependent methyltransferase
MTDHSLLRRLEEALSFQETTHWSLTLGGEPPHARLFELIQGLQGDVDTGDNKKIDTKFSYLGVGPAIDWVNACHDLFYPVMREGIQSFPRHWNPLAASLRGQNFHYVSFGVGDGQKDRVVLNDLISWHPDLLYVPIDLSVEMLHVGTEQSVKDPRLGKRVLPIHLDFSVMENLVELKQLLHRLLGDDPILFGLIGNTVANTDTDLDQLTDIREIMRPQDRLLLEVATTTSMDTVAIRRAAQEYANSEPYRIHATSALAQNTDLKIDTHFVEIRVAPEGTRALRIEAHYVNRSGAAVQMVLPNRAQVGFREGETIRVTLSRKYTRDGINDLIKDAGLTAVESQAPAAQPPRSRAPLFGLEVELFEAPASAPPQRTVTVADEIWPKVQNRR